METTTPLSSAPLLPAEREQLQPALAARYDGAKAVLGSQLGAFVRRHLKNPDLKARFGGLKNFVSQSFPAEIRWRGRQGLDDLYDVSFSAEESAHGGGVWQPVSSEPSAELWPAITNPSIYVQFAWSAKDESLLRASVSVPLAESLVAVEKLTRADYQNIAANFVSSTESIDATVRPQLLDNLGSSTKFTKIIRESGLLAKWEEFRVDHALRLFTNRLGTAGAESSIVARWEGLLRSSHERLRAERSQRLSAASPVQRSQALAGRQNARDETPDIRSVAMKAMEFLSDSELSELRLPLGSVMHALASLPKR
jgi:hypothetical protein